MSGLWVGITLDHKAREYRLFVVDDESFASALSVTEFPTVHYQSPIVIWDAILDYTDREDIEYSTAIMIKTVMVNTTGTPVSVGQVKQMFGQLPIEPGEYDPLEFQSERERQETLDELNRFDQGLENMLGGVE